MGKLQSGVESGHLAREDPSSSRDELLLPISDQPRLTEECAGKSAATISDGRLESRLRPSPSVGAIIKVERTSLDYFGQHRDFLVFSQRREIAQLGSREVAAGYVPH